MAAGPERRRGHPLLALRACPLSSCSHQIFSCPASPRAASIHPSPTPPPTPPHTPPPTHPPGACRMRRCLFLLPLLLAALSPFPLPAAETKPPATRLAVLVCYDQLRGDYLTRWDDLFGEGGFHRLEKDGAWFQDCHCPYAGTETGPGHASVATGCSPCKHGIIINDWYDRTAGHKVYCAATDRYRRVPPPPADGKASAEKLLNDSRGQGAPDRLLAPTLGDALKAATAGKGKVVALSLKDRSSVLPGGKKPDACYWFDTADGQFVTSTYYRGRPHPWVEQFNKDRIADRWFGKQWDRLRSDLEYERRSGPDDVTGEGRGVSFGPKDNPVYQGRTFPHPLSAGLKEPGKPYYDALYNSPFGNELLLALVKRAIDAEELGRHDTPDFLSVSFSSNDPVGHCWGPDSQEVLDTTLRTDRVVKELCDTLDAKVGKGRWTLVLTADHGVCPVPEVGKAQGKEAGRVIPSLLGAKANAFLQEKFGGDAEATWVEATATPWVYLNRRLIRQRFLNQSDVENALAGWLRKQPAVQAVYTRTQLLKGVDRDDPLG